MELSSHKITMSSSIIALGKKMTTANIDIVADKIFKLFAQISSPEYPAISFEPVYTCT